MNIQQPTKRLWINAYMLMFIVHTAQTGVGIVGMPRVVFLESAQDAWISVMIGSLVAIPFAYVIYYTLKPFGRLDLYAIHDIIYGKWIGKLLNFFYAFYLSWVFFNIVMNYIEMIQAWVFNLLPTWLMFLLLAALAIYAVQGGLRVVTGVTILSFLLSTWLVFMIAVPIQYIETTQYFPLFNHSFKEMMMATLKTSYTILGFEILFFVYPFVDDQKKTMRYVNIALIYTTIQITLVTIVCIGFFSDVSLEKTIWPVLSMFKIVRLPNLERFEFIAVSFWMLVILPNLALYLWAASRGVRHVFNIPQKYAVWIIVTVGFVAQYFLDSRLIMNLITDKLATTGMYMSFIYPVIIFLLVRIHLYRKKGAKPNEKSTNN
ncbi:GerAB/ArcD/ProY family transporter [Mangrovibacillus cuniculi]|uniref:GerAB/ArcD/ProY family transporter n=1 Tax=Mangrovibacillus cuniculi TaxID=2593652 RepID=A0A7S8HF53_9BACI|nr:GerAB/ArcD/ProY family transporter [Mangrovibacillus cuniculi]QPC46549.1 GerAB/ArcD/ProY family transporter [Mangrovibacillus cuniculi]